MRIWIGSVFQTIQHVLIMRFFPVNIKQLFFAPEAKTRQWLYKKEIQAVSIPKYYLDFAEYNEAKLDKIAIFL